MIECGNEHDRGECIPLFCVHPDHYVTDAEVDLDELIVSQLGPVFDQGFVDLT